MTQVEAVQLWMRGAEDAWDTAQQLFAAKKYHHALFFGQMYLEKLLKGLHYDLKDDHPPFTHNLVLIAKKAEIKLVPQQIENLDEISSFNITARYPEHKQELFTKATLGYTKKWMKLIEDFGSYFKGLFHYEIQPGN